MISTGFALWLAACAHSIPASPPAVTSAMTTSIPPAATPTPATPVLDLNAGYPLALNNTWVYRSTRYEGFNSAIMTTTSTITETVVDVKTDPAYVAAKIRQDTSAEIPIAGPSDLQNLRPASTSQYWLVRADRRLYRQDANLDLSNPDSRDSLELTFPLQAMAQWVWLPAKLPTDPDTSGVLRQVLTVGKVQVPAGRFDSCFLIKDRWVTDTVESWFCPGVGWVDRKGDRKGDHNGTPYGSRRVLLRYELDTSSATTPPGPATALTNAAKLARNSPAAGDASGYATRSASSPASTITPAPLLAFRIR